MLKIEPKKLKKLFRGDRLLICCLTQRLALAGKNLFQGSIKDTTFDGQRLALFLQNVTLPCTVTEECTSKLCAEAQRGINLRNGMYLAKPLHAKFSFATVTECG
jgi:hypothetical protein